jgi:uncharacterized sulfatase
MDEANQLGMGSLPDLLTDLQRSVVAPTKPEEELYDISVDPHETVNLAGDPRCEDALKRLRTALDDWTHRYGDLGLIPESELVERWRPGGRPQTTAAPEVTVEDGRITVTCSTEGASVGWTTDAPSDDEQVGLAKVLGRTIGSPQTGGRHWHLYSEPFLPPAGETVWVGAWRLGFEASEIVAVEP